MKTLRFFTLVLVAVLLFSTWAPAYASSTSSVDLAAAKLAKLKVNNQTGGTLYVSFAGPFSYSFSTSKQGKTTFQPVIRPGKYNVTVRTSGCPGQLNYRKNVKGGTVSLPTFICRHK